MQNTTQFFILNKFYIFVNSEKINSPDFFYSDKNCTFVLLKH